MDLFGIVLLSLVGYAVICYTLVLILDSAADSKLDTMPVFLASFFFTPLVGGMVALVNIISKSVSKNNENKGEIINS